LGFESAGLHAPGRAGNLPGQRLGIDGTVEDGLIMVARRVRPADG